MLSCFKCVQISVYYRFEYINDRKIYEIFEIHRSIIEMIEYLIA